METRSFSVKSANYWEANDNDGKSKHSVDVIGGNKSYDGCEQFQVDHKIFLEVFEKPTKIYQFLRARNVSNPIFLNRNLTFMRHRSLSRNSATVKMKSRKKFRVDDLLTRKSADCQELESENGSKGISCNSSVSGTLRPYAVSLSSSTETKKSLTVIYQFLYQHNLALQDDARNDLVCPWCGLNCMALYALLKHLKLSHPRFLFNLVQLEEGARIDVSVSELFDMGTSDDANISQSPRFPSSQKGPVRQPPITKILVCKLKRNEHEDISELLNGDFNLSDPPDAQEMKLCKLNCHYVLTNLPMPSDGPHIPSTENLSDPMWAKEKMCQMIDEFTDLNKGEKEFLKMWNMHVQHYNFLGDLHMPLALKIFIDEKGREILERRLYRNFILHCCNLYEHSILSPEEVFTAIIQLQHFIKHNELQKYFTHWEDQLKKASHEWSITNSHTSDSPPVKIPISNQQSSFSELSDEESTFNHQIQTPNKNKMCSGSGENRCVSPDSTTPEGTPFRISNFI